MKIALIVITLSIMIIPFLVMLMMKGVSDIYKKAAGKISDREFLQLFTEEGYVLTSKQLVQKTPLSSTETTIYVSRWNNAGILRQLYSNDGHTLYQLKDKLPKTQDIYKLSRYSDREALELLLEHLDNAELAIAQLIWLFDIKLKEARDLMKRWVNIGLVKTHLNSSLQRVYISNISFKNSNKEKIAIPTEEEERTTPINDSDILRLAIDHEGRLTPTLICVEKRISLEDAQELLDKLYEKGAFHIEVDEENGNLEYLLRDTKLYKKK